MTTDLEAKSLRRRQFKPEDLVQLAVGACVLAIPIAYTEEVWNLGASLPPGRILLIVLVSLTTLAGFVRVLVYRDGIAGHWRDFTLRVAAAYVMTLAISLMMLVLIDKGPADGLGLALRRAVLIAYPASFAATAVDYFK